MKLQKVIVGFLMILLFSTCSNSFLPLEDITDSDTKTVTSPVSYDSKRNIVVFSSGDGTLIDIESNDEEEGVNYKCIEPLEYKVFDDTNNSRNAENPDSLQAVVVGRRNDNNRAVWLIHKDGSVSFPFNEKTGKSSSRFQFAGEDFDTDDILGEEFEGSLGWSFYPEILSDDGMMIGGYAYNEAGFTQNFFHDRYTLEIAPESRAGVYWFLYENPEGKYFISGTQVAGLVEYADSSYGVFKYWFLNLISKLKLYFLDDLDNYLKDIVSIEADEVEGQYVLNGTDKAGLDATALVDRKRVLSIEEEEVQVENSAPNNILGPDTINVSISSESTRTELVVDSPDGLLDPDRDFVELHYNILFQTTGTAEDIILNFDIVDGKGILETIHPGSDFYGHGAQLEIWLEDPEGLTSQPFTILLMFEST